MAWSVPASALASSLCTSSNAADQALQDGFLKAIASQECPRRFPEASNSANEAYADLDTSKQPHELSRLKDQFKDMELRANAKVTNDRVFSMAVHPDKRRNLVFAGDKYGALGM